MLKKSSIGTVFIYAISAIVIILIFYFGYRAVTGFQKANEDSIAERMQLRMKADMNQLSIRYGTRIKFNYDTSKYFTKICFVDLNLNETNTEIRNNFLNSNYPLILDSINANSPNNVFAFGERVLAFDVGKLRVSCSPYVFCLNSTRGKISFFAEGGGDSVMITCET